MDDLITTIPNLFFKHQVNIAKDFLYYNNAFNSRGVLVTTNYGQTVYSQGSGTASTSLLDAHRDNRNPNSSDVAYPLGKYWVNTNTNAVFYYASQTSNSGQLQAVWVALSNGSLTPAIFTIDTIPPDGAGNFTIESTDGSIAISGVANGINLIVATSPTKYDGNTGGDVMPNGANQLFIVGNNTFGINVVGNPATNTLTVTSLQATTTQEGTITLATNAQAIAGTDAFNAITSTSLGAKLGTQTAHGVAVFEGTTGAMVPIGPSATTGAILQNNAGADPSYSTAAYPSTVGSVGTILRSDGTNWVATTATYPATTTINQILYSSAANTVTGLATANQGVLTTGATGTPVITALATDGQLIIGSTAGVPAASTLTPGAGISITNAGNSITIAATGAGFAWSDQSGSFAAVKENGYFITATSTATLPASPAEGDTISFVVDSTQFLTITGNTGQKIRIGNVISAAAGTAVSNARGDAVRLVYRSTGTTWFSEGGPQGTWSVT